MYKICRQNKHIEKIRTTRNTIKEINKIIGQQTGFKNPSTKSNEFKLDSMKIREILDEAKIVFLKREEEKEKELRKVNMIYNEKIIQDTINYIKQVLNTKGKSSAEKYEYIKNLYICEVDGIMNLKYYNTLSEDERKKCIIRALDYLPLKIQTELNKLNPEYLNKTLNTIIPVKEQEKFSTYRSGPLGKTIIRTRGGRKKRSKRLFKTRKNSRTLHF